MRTHLEPPLLFLFPSVVVDVVDIEPVLAVVSLLPLSLTTRNMVVDVKNVVLQAESDVTLP